MGEKMNVGELSYCQLMERMLRAEQRVAELEEQLSMEESQFLTDVLTAAGLLACGKQDKGLARRIADFCVSKRANCKPAQLRQGGVA